jgi:two-component system sensor histidine kinase UhpB
MGPPSVPRESPTAPGPSPEPGGGPPVWLDALLRVPLFWKLLVANVLLVAGVGAAAVWAVDLVRLPLVPAVVVAMLGAVGLAALVNAAAVRLALRPVDTLTETAQRVRGGDWDARAPASALADHGVDRLRHVVNEMLDAVTAARRRHRELSRQVLEAEERERERIAHELYAGTAQTLAGVLVRLRLLEREAAGEPARGPLDEITAEVRQALEEIRALARRLRPPELDELGVRAALEAHARQLGAGAGGPVRMEFHGRVPESCLSDDARMALFRVVQEALTNAARHAQARHVHTHFLQAADALVVEVEDDGRGFDPTAAGAAPNGAGLGLPGMEERAGYAGGSLTVVSAPGEGTRLRLLLPWATPPDVTSANHAPVPARPVISVGAPS